jgi:hypothetical protein
MLRYVGVSKKRSGKYVAAEIRFFCKPESFYEINTIFHGEVEVYSWKPTQYGTRFHVNDDSTRVSTATNKYTIKEELLEVVISIWSSPKL